MEMNGDFHGPAALPEAGWTPQAVLTFLGREKFLSAAGIRIPNHPARCPVLSLYRRHYHDPETTQVRTQAHFSERKKILLKHSCLSSSELPQHTGAKDCNRTAQKENLNFSLNADRCE